MVVSDSTKPNNNNSTMFRAHLARIIQIVAFFVVWSVLYSLVNSWASVPGRAHIFISPIAQHRQLFQSWASLIYIFGGWLTLIIPFYVHWTTIGVRRVLFSMIITCGIALLFYFLWPVVITRPDYSVPGFGSVLMRWLTSVDQPANTFPSGHTFFAILAALWVQHSSVQRFVKISVWGLCVVVAASTILVGQHYYWDIAGGVVVGWIGYLTAIKILPTSQ